MQQLALFDSDLCQRWNAGRHSWRRTTEGGFNPRRYTVAPISEADARAFVTTHHYSRAYPAARLRHGLIEGGRLVGVAVLGVPMSAGVLTGPFPTLEPYREALELSRLVLLDAVPANAESWFVAQVFDLAAAEGLRGVVAFSDPMPRELHGEMIMPGHVGILYQALNATYTGRGTARTLTILPDGSVLTDRAAQKIRTGERGDGHVIARLVAFGAEPLSHILPPTAWAAGEGDLWARAARWQSLAEAERRRVWLRHALDRIGARRVRHHGNHRFVWTVGTRAQRRRTPVALEALPYPKTPDALALAA